MSRVFSEELVNSVAKEMKVADLANATIGDVLLVASRLEELTGIPFIRMDQGSPGLPANKIGIEAEKKALDRGVGSQYPAAAGVAELKQAASRFVKAFIDIDISPRACLPTTGSVAASFGAFIACTQRIPGKNKVLFIDPGFPIQKSQLRILGIEWELFDIHDFRGEPLRAKLESFLSKGDIAAVVYSNPNNPAWICLEESELKIIGELATQYDVIVLEDQAYFCMDFRHAFGRPYQPPFVPTVARYTDNYILMLSASKIFSYAGQRIALACVSDKLFDTQYPALAVINGELKVVKKYRGSLPICVGKYITDRLVERDDIEDSLVFISSCQPKPGCMDAVKAGLKKYASFKECHETDIGTTIGGYSGPGTIGIVFARKEK
jgi:aspartate/methionine/tyrosine aminotransferase